MRKKGYKMCPIARKIKGRLKDDIDRLPDEPGIYIITDNNEQAVYVGQSIHPRRRVLEHITDHNPEDHPVLELFDRVSFVPVPRGKLTSAEAGLANKLRPILWSKRWQQYRRRINSSKRREQWQKG